MKVMNKSGVINTVTDDRGKALLKQGFTEVKEEPKKKKAVKKEPKEQEIF